MSIEDICGAFQRYYNSLGRGTEYLNEDNVGKFSYYCDENGIEDDGMDDEIDAGWDQTPLVDFDEEFPFEIEPENEEEKKKKIFNLIKLCRSNPNISFNYKVPQFNKSHIDEADQKSMDVVSKTFKNYCPKIWNEGMQGDEALLRLLAVGQNNNFPLLQSLFDVYSGDRLKQYETMPNKPLEIGEWRFVCKFFKRFKNDKEKELTVAALESCNKRCTPKLLFNCLHTINDSIEQIAKYIDGLITFISNMIKTEAGLLPFQLDVCIASGKSSTSNKHEAKEEDNGDDINYVGNIENKLKNNKLRYIKGELNPSEPEYEVSIARSRAFKKLLRQFIKKNDIPEQNHAHYLRDKRLIFCIDRRKSKNDIKRADDIFIYEPPKGSYTQDIPRNAPAEWFVSASRTCLIPPMEYDEDDATGNNKAANIDKEQRNEDKMDKTKEKNIGATFHCNGAMLTVSFHVKTANEIKCYLYYNGQVIRFMPKEMRTLFGIIFSLKYGHNKKYLESDPDLDGLIKAMDAKLVDEPFQAFKSSLN